MKVSTENDNNFGYEKITIVVDNLPLTITSRGINLSSFVQGLSIFLKVHWSRTSEHQESTGPEKFSTGPRAADKLRICVFYAMKTSKNACIIRSECTQYAYILLCNQTFQIRSVLVQLCT